MQVNALTGTGKKRKKKKYITGMSNAAPRESLSCRVLLNTHEPANPGLSNY